MMSAKKPDGSQATGMLELSYQSTKGKETTTTTIHISGCFVKNDKNLRRFIKGHISPSANMKKLKKTKFLFCISNSELLKQEGIDSKATINYHRFSESKKDKACEPVQNPQIVKVGKHAFLLCDSKDLNKKCDFLEEYAKEVRTHQTLCMDDIESKKFFGLGKEESKLKFISLEMKNSESSASNEFSVDSTTYGKLEDTGPILLDDNKTVVGCFRKTTDNSKLISISIFGENQVQGSSSANDIHPTITSSASKTSPSCNGTSSSNGIPSRNDNPSSNCDLETTDHSDGPQSRRQMADDVQESSSANDKHPTITSSTSKTNPSCNGTSSNDLPSRNDNPSSNDNHSFNGILSFNGIPSRNDNPSSNCIPSSKSTASSNSSQKGSDLKTTDHSDGSQSTRQMADDGEPVIMEPVLTEEEIEEKVVEESSLTNEKHPSTTISTSKINLSCNGNLSSNSSQIGSVLETDHSDGSQSTRQMADTKLNEKRERRSSENTKLHPAIVVLIVLIVLIFLIVVSFYFTPKNHPPNIKTDQEKENKTDRIFTIHNGIATICKVHLATILHHPGVKNGLFERLDPEYRALPNWEHFADRVKAPTSVKEEGRSYTKYSPTELLFEVPKASSLKVNSLLTALRDIKRDDVYNKIIKAIPENERNMKVSETLLTDDHLLDEAAVMLDTPRKGFPNNWEVLGLKLGVARDDLDQIKRGNNPANQLLQYAYRKLEAKKLKAGYFYRLFLEREDIKNFLDGLGITQEDNRSIKTIFKPNSRNMHELCALLNTNLGGTANNWRYLAYKWGMEADIYNKFDKTYQEKPSPTGKLLDWLIKEHPSFSVGELCEHLEEIGRSDVKDFLLEKAHEYFDVRR